MSSTISRIVDNAGQGFLPGSTIRDDEVDAELDQLVGAHNSLVSDKLERDGSQDMQGDLGMGGFKLTNVGDGTDPGDVVNKGQLDAAITGNNEWTELTDTPGSISASSFVIGNVGGTGLEFVAESDYMLADGTRAFTGEVAGITPTSATSLATKSYVDQTWGLNGGSVVLGSLGNNVGIGVATASNKLEVLESYASTTGIEDFALFTRMSDGIAANGIGGRIRFAAENSASVGNSCASIAWGMSNVTNGNESGFLQLETRENGGSLLPRLFIKSNGEIGIGTTNPNSPLEVNGLVHSTSGGFRFPDGSTQTTAAATPVTTFTGLSDTPGSINANQLVRGNGAGNALEFVDLSSLSHNSLANLTIGHPHTQYVLASGSIASFTSRSHGDLQDLTADHHTRYVDASAKRTVGGGAIDSGITASAGDCRWEILSQTNAAEMRVSVTTGFNADLKLNSGSDQTILRMNDGLGYLKVVSPHVSSAMDMDAKNIVNLADPTSSGHAATKNYVDDNNGPKQAYSLTASNTGTDVTLDLVITGASTGAKPLSVDFFAVVSGNVILTGKAFRVGGTWTCSGLATDAGSGNSLDADNGTSSLTFSVASVTWTVTFSTPAANTVRVYLSKTGGSDTLELSGTAACYRD